MTKSMNDASMGRYMLIGVINCEPGSCSKVANDMIHEIRETHVVEHVKRSVSLL